MAMFKRLLILGAAGAGAAWFLKKKQQGSGEQPLFEEGGRATAGGGATTTDVGDAAAAGTGTSETLQEAGAQQPEPPAPDSPAEDAGAGETSGEAPTRVANPVVPDTSPDPLVRRQEDAAAAEAGSIGGEAQTPPSRDDAGLAQDPAMKPVVEASGEEQETLEETDRDLGADRERHG
jgi:hypothetical protein